MKVKNKVQVQDDLEDLLNSTDSLSNAYKSSSKKGNMKKKTKKKRSVYSSSNFQKSETAD